MKKYNIILCDPPWVFKDKNTGCSMKSGSAAHYKVMTLKDICELPVQKIAVRGNPKRIDAAIRSVIVAPVGKHSEKPAVVRKIIVKLAGDLPRVELFARTHADGLASFGDEISNSIKL